MAHQQWPRLWRSILEHCHGVLDSLVTGSWAWDTRPLSQHMASECIWLLHRAEGGALAIFWSENYIVKE